jgi:hypothetical protein
MTKQAQPCWYFVACLARSSSLLLIGPLWFFLVVTRGLSQVYPGTSLAVAQSFICRRIYNQTYLIASLYKDACPWGGLELVLWRLDTWSVLAWISLILVFLYPIGVPLLM